MNWETLATLAIWAAAGGAVALVNLALLRHGVARMAAGGTPLRAAAALILRLALAGVTLWLAAQAGAAPLLAAAAALLATRAAVLGRITRAGR